MSNESISNGLNPYLQVAGWGFMAGLRSMAAPALLSEHLRQHPSPYLAGSWFGLLSSPTVATLFKLLAAGEIVADKLPILPPRTATGPLLGRAVVGALVGAALAAATGKRPAIGAVIGGLAAVAGAHAGYYLRTGLEKRLQAPDPLVAIFEDMAVLAGLSLLRSELANEISE